MSGVPHYCVLESSCSEVNRQSVNG
jgi:hypothetical protein